MIAIIPARGGSVRIPWKNIKLFRGKPMLAYPIEAARGSKLFDRVIVSTDSSRIAEVAYNYGAEVYERPTDDGARGTQDVAREVLEAIPTDYACVIYPCTPMLRASDLIDACSWLRTDADTNYVMSVLTDGSTVSDAGMFYFGRAEAFIEDRPLYGNGVLFYSMPSGRGIDINTPEDWARAERMAWRLNV